MSGIPDLDQYGELCPSVVTFEHRTLNLEPINLNMSIAEIYVSPHLGATRFLLY